MRNKENGLALFGKILHNLHKLINFCGSKDRRRLIKDENLIISVKHLKNLGSLLHTDSNILNLGIGIDFKTVLLRKLQYLLSRHILL